MKYLLKYLALVLGMVLGGLVLLVAVMMIVPVLECLISGTPLYH